MEQTRPVMPTAAPGQQENSCSAKPPTQRSAGQSALGYCLIWANLYLSQRG